MIKTDLSKGLYFENPKDGATIDIMSIEATEKIAIHNPDLAINIRAFSEALNNAFDPNHPMHAFNLKIILDALSDFTNTLEQMAPHEISTKDHNSMALRVQAGFYINNKVPEEFLTLEAIAKDIK